MVLKNLIAGIMLIYLFSATTVDSKAEVCNPCLGEIGYVDSLHKHDDNNGTILPGSTRYSSKQTGYNFDYTWFDCPDDKSNNLLRIKLDKISGIDKNNNPTHIGIEIAVREVILGLANGISNPSSFDEYVNEFGCFDLEVTLPSCWKPDNIEEKSFIPCEGTQCCVSTYRICKKIETNEYYIENGIGLFDGSTPPNWDEDCEAVEPCLHVCESLLLGMRYFVKPNYPPTCSQADFPYGWSEKFSYCLMDENNGSTLMTIYYRFGTQSDNTKVVEIMYIGNLTSTPEEAYKRSIISVLKNIHYDTGENDNTIKLVIPACWQIFDDHYLWACDVSDNECCYTMYDVSYDALSGNTYVNSWQHFDEDACNSCPYPTSNCHICFCGNSDVFDIDPSLALYKSNSSDKALDEFNIIVLPNPTKATTELIVEGNEKGSITLIVTDMKGNQILKIDDQKTNNLFNFKFETNKFSNGVYHYIVLIDGNPIGTGKFVKTN